MNFIDEALSNLRIQEGEQVVEQFMIECYLTPGISIKELARKTLLPVPIAAAIKNELIKGGALIQDRGVRCTVSGEAFVEKKLGFAGMDKVLYKKLMLDCTDWRSLLEDILIKLKRLFELRPQVDVQIDQSKCTAETSLARAILCLQEHTLIGKKILCVGDDDLVSISLSLLLNRLFPSKEHRKTVIDVVDVDDRFLTYIHQIAEELDLPIKCHNINFKNALPKKLHEKYDCFFTDPPYTLQGLVLFVSRGISALKKSKGLTIFLSYANKSPNFMLNVHQEFLRMGLSVKEMIVQFNEYEGAQMIGSKGQMIVLKTTDFTEPIYTTDFDGALYTGEVNRTERRYRCKKCQTSILVGMNRDFPTIEKLKSSGCPHCGHFVFNLVEKKYK